jgi:hypothetical protein
MDSVAFEWIDPFAEKSRADRAERQAASAHEDGRRAVLRTLEEAMKSGFRQKLDMAVEQVATRVAHHMLQEVGAAWSYRYFSERQHPEVAEAFRRGCESVLNAVIKPDVGLARLRIDHLPDAAEAVMSVEYDIVKPIHLARTTRL